MTSSVVSSCCCVVLAVKASHKVVPVVPRVLRGTRPWIPSSQRQTAHVSGEVILDFLVLLGCAEPSHPGVKLEAEVEDKRPKGAGSRVRVPPRDRQHHACGTARCRRIRQSMRPLITRGICRTAAQAHLWSAAASTLSALKYPFIV